jgi:NADH-quinone oxidoreductase subunit M
LTGIGILIGVAYTLRVLQKAFFGEPDEKQEHTHEPMPPISPQEKLGAILLIVVSLVIGLFPRILLDIIVPSFDSPLFDWLRRLS